MSACRGCGATIIWVVTQAGRRMPVEWSQGGNLVLRDGPRQAVAVIVPDGQGTHVSHFATCPKAGDFRSSR